jgi:hypothetical protein
MAGENMLNNNSNPLAKHFRQPAIYIKLPSDGAFYDEDIVEMPENGEIPIYPMTALDEISYRTADALFNGAAIASVVKSCIPAFKDAWKISTLDLDTLLIAIRIASYGHEMEFTSKCPKCSESNEFGIDLRNIMDRIKTPDFSTPVSAGDIQIHFKPLNYKEQNSNNMLQFQDQKMLEALPDADIEEAEKLTAKNSQLTLTMCVNYGGRAEITDAVQAISAKVASGQIQPSKITERMISAHLDEPDMPDVDLFVRSSGEQRMSNFLLWQSAYAEFVFLDTLWPDFDRRQLWEACEIYAARNRRYGGAS